MRDEVKVNRFEKEKKKTKQHVYLETLELVVGDYLDISKTSLNHLQLVRILLLAHFLHDFVQFNEIIPVDPCVQDIYRLRQ